MLERNTRGALGCCGRLRGCFERFVHFHLIGSREKLGLCSDGGDQAYTSRLGGAQGSKSQVSSLYVAPETGLGVCGGLIAYLVKTASGALFDRLP